MYPLNEYDYTNETKINCTDQKKNCDLRICRNNENEQCKVTWNTKKRWYNSLWYVIIRVKTATNSCARNLSAKKCSNSSLITHDRYLVKMCRMQQFWIAAISFVYHYNVRTRVVRLNIRHGMNIRQLFLCLFAEITSCTKEWQRRVETKRKKEIKQRYRKSKQWNGDEME